MEDDIFWGDEVNFREEENFADNSSEVSSDIETLLYSQLHHDSPNHVLNSDTAFNNGIVPFSQKTDPNKSSNLMVSSVPDVEVKDFSSEQGISLCVKSLQNSERSVIVIDSDYDSNSDPDIHFRKKLKNSREPSNECDSLQTRKNAKKSLRQNSEHSVIVIDSDCDSNNDPDMHFKEKLNNSREPSNECNSPQTKKKSKKSPSKGSQHDLRMLLSEKTKSPSKLNNSKSSVPKLPKNVNKKKIKEKHKCSGENTPSSVNKLINLYKVQMEKFYNSESTVINVEDKDFLSGSQWHLDPEDRYPENSTHRFRFFNRMDFAFCYICKRRGHLARLCDQARKPPRCLLCGVGGHFEENCFDAICGKCFSPGHFVEHCQLDEKDMWVKCPICYMPGHMKEECPDVWKRYYLTTSPGSIVSSDYQQRNKKVYCYNCGRKNHFGHECAERRMNVYTFPTSPFIMSYSDPSVDLYPKIEDKRFQQLREHKQTFAAKSNSEFQCFASGGKDKRKWLEKLRKKLISVGKRNIHRSTNQKSMQRLKQGKESQKLTNEIILISSEDSPKKSRESPKKRKRKKKKNANLNVITTNLITQCNNHLNRFPNGKLATSLKEKALKQKDVLKTINGSLHKKKKIIPVHRDFIVK